MSRLFVSFLLLNIFFLILNSFTLFSLNMRGMSGNAAGGFAIIIIGAVVALLIHLIFIVVIYFTRSMLTLYVVTGLSGICAILCGMILGSKALVLKREAEYLNKLEIKHENYLAGIGISNDPQHETFTKAIAANESDKVHQLIQDGTRVQSGDLKFAAELLLVHNKPISVSIFKNLIDHYSEPHLSDEIIELVLYYHRADRDCTSGHLEVVELFLSKDLRLLPERAFPLVCKETLQLLLDRGVDVNLLTITNYTYHPTTNPEVQYFPHWTPVMVYMNAFPDYYEEAKLLLSYQPDLRHVDENGYSLQEIIETKVRETELSSQKELHRQQLAQFQRALE